MKLQSKHHNIPLTILVTTREIKIRSPRKRTKKENLIKNSLMLLNRWSCNQGIIGAITGGTTQTLCSKGVKKDIMGVRPASLRLRVLVYRLHMKEETTTS